MFSSVSTALIDCTRDGVVIPVVQRSKDGYFPVDPEFYDEQPSSHGQHHHLSSVGPVQGDPAFPGELHGIMASMGPGPVQASPYDNFCPGGPCHQAPGPGQMPSFDQMMLRCSDMMELLIQQQHQLQQALAAMAAAPFCSIQPKHEIPQQLPTEVMSTAQSCVAPCQPAHICEPRSCTPVCQNSPVPAENAESSRAHTGMSASQQNFVRSAGETTSDVTSDDHRPQKHTNFGKQLSRTDEVASADQQFQLKPANSSRFQNTQASASTIVQNGTPADNIDQHLEQFFIRSASYAAYGAAPRELGRQKQVNSILNLLVMCQQKYSSPISKVTASVNGCFWMRIIRGLRPKQGISVSYFDYLPPWPPPVCILNITEHAFNKIRGGKNDIKRFLVAVSTCQTTCPTCPDQAIARSGSNRPNRTVSCVSQDQSFPSTFLTTITVACNLNTITSLAVASNLQRAQHRDLQSPSPFSTSTFSCLFTSMFQVCSMVVELHHFLR